jgi:hypothetical protein
LTDVGLQAVACGAFNYQQWIPWHRIGGLAVQNTQWRGPAQR